MKDNALRVLGLYPKHFAHRGNTDHLYTSALARMYQELGWEYSVVDARPYGTLATFLYLLSNQASRRGAAGLARSLRNRFTHLPLPKRYLEGYDRYHGPFIPSNLRRGLVYEGEFYLFEDTPENRRIQHAQLPPSWLPNFHRIVVRTELSGQHFAAQYPTARQGLQIDVPFYMPYLEKWETREPRKPGEGYPLALVFVGNQARRKGLDIFVRLCAAYRRVHGKDSLRAVVVSNFRDGRDFDLSGCEVHEGCNGAQVQALMEQAHYLVLPTRGDSHPKVCYEASACGCGLILSDIRPLRDVWANHSEILRNEPSETEVTELVRRLSPRAGLAQGAGNRARFLAEFSPAAARRRYAEAVR